MRSRREALMTVPLTLVIAAACGPPSVGLPEAAGPILNCADVPQIAAAPELYRDRPIYVENEMPTDAVQAWASTKAGFEGIWIDREHHGWVTVAFSRDANLRQAEIASEFPNDGVVAVAVDWAEAELEALQQRVMNDFKPDVQGAGIKTNYGVVAVFLGFLEPDKVARFKAKFAGARICYEGIDPALAPAEGPQQQSGDGWRLVADQDHIGPPYRTAIAAETSAYLALWSQIGLVGEPPAVDFQAEVVIWFGAVHGSSCPRLRLDGVVVDAGKALVYAEITSFTAGACTADAIGHAYLVAVERSKLPKGPFKIQLEGGERPAGVVEEERTIVDADLSVPGATLSADQLHSATPFVDGLPTVEAGGVIDSGSVWQFSLSVRCGIEWLGPINSTWWRTDVSARPDPFVPAAWQPLVTADRTITLEVLMVTEPQPMLTATAAKHDEIYVPSPIEAPACN